MNRMTLLCIAAMSAAAASCSSQDHAEFRHLSVLDASRIAVHAPDRPDAILTAGGGLNIEGKSIPHNAEQSQIILRYFVNAMALRDDAVKTGAAGVSTAATAFTSVAVGLASGNPDSIDSKVNASAAKVDAAANKVCADLQALAKAQDELAAALPQFKPYATIRAGEVNDCKSD